MTDSVGVSLLGAGNVGAAVLSALIKDTERNNQLVGTKLELRYVLVRDIKKHDKKFKDVNFTKNFNDVLNDEHTSIIVELMGGQVPAKEYIASLLKKGKHVVTANKDVMAQSGSELTDLAVKHGASIRYEASVGGGIPIIGPLSRDLLANEIFSISGIINGTTNYMLSLMFQEKMSYQNALLKAQQSGYAEPDPYNDVQGIDAAYKLAILCGLAFHVDVDPGSIFCQGISSIELKDLNYADELGYVIKLLARAELIDNKITCIVCPTLISKQEPLSKVDGVLNAIQLQGNLVGQVIFEGPGAGASATSSAILGDVIDAAKNIKYSFSNLNNAQLNKIEVSNSENFISRYYLRLNVVDESGVLAAISGIMSEHQISIASVIQTEADQESQTAQLVLITHEANRGKIDSAINSIKKEKKVDSVVNLLPIID
ncbi:MAG: homoserine dehydrogenase [Dehalococcoidia bacterium]|nr:homoserine dehydrogenase [Dehalococcoidia bacterium]